jgi:hypothetical protein
MTAYLLILQLATHTFIHHKLPVEVEIGIERDKTHKSRLLLCESHVELVEKGIPFRMRSTKKE